MQSLIPDSRVYRLARNGSTPALTRQTRSIPPPGPLEVVLRVDAASLNYRDLLVIGDGNGTQDGLIPLSDCAGTIVTVGSQAGPWQPGDRVSPNFFPDWVRGTFRADYFPKGLGGGQTHGVLAEHITVPAASLVRVAPHLNQIEAACLPCAAVTAWHGLFERGNLQSGETVLVQGTGGVAMFGLQLAQAQGARVIVISSSDKKLARAKTLGAWQTINYKTQPDWHQSVLALTDGRGADHILELGGPATYERSIASVAAGGKISQIGVLTGFASQPNLLPLQIKNASIHGICVGSAEHFMRLNQFLAAHAIHPIVDTQVTFNDAAVAYELLQKASHLGKIVISVG